MSATPLPPIEIALEKFLAKKDSVLVVRGEWGVGKTFFWDHFVKTRLERKEIKHSDAYSYVSLFGKTSVSDVQAAIFHEGKIISSSENIEENIKKQLQGSSAASAIIEKSGTSFLAKLRAGGKFSQYAKFFPGADRVGKLWNTLEYKLIGNYLICIDDLERKGASLSVKELMGLIDELARRKHCQIVLIFNDQSFGDEKDRKDYEEYREKVVDFEIKYDPSYEHIVDCVFDDDYLLKSRILKICRTLQIKNIRVLTKLKHVLDSFNITYTPDSALIAEEFLAHAAIQVFSYYMPSRFLQHSFVVELSRTSSWASFLPEGQVSPDESKYRAVAQELRISPSPLVDVIANFLINGFVDFKNIREISERRLEEKIKLQAQSRLFNVWELYTGTFSDNAEEIVRRMTIEVRENMDILGMSEISSALELLSFLGADVSDLLKIFVEKNGPALQSKRLKDEVVNRSVTFEPLRKKIHELSNASISLDLDSIAGRIYENRSWDRQEISFLASLSQDDYQAWMESNPRQLVEKIRGGLMIFNMTSSSVPQDTADYVKIARAVTGALKMIARSSALNQRRVESLYGITIDD